MDPSTMLSGLRARLKRHEGSYPAICAMHRGLTYSWVTKFAHGKAPNPTVTNLQALKEALDLFEEVPADAETTESAGEE